MMRSLALTLLLGAVWLALPAHALAQADALEITDVRTVGYPTVELTVTVPRAVADVTLPADAFGITEDGEYLGRPSLGRSDATDEPSAPRVVLAIDTSGSMFGEPIDKARAAAAEFVRSLRDGGEIAVVTFADEAAVVAEFTADKAEIYDRIASIEVDPTGETALRDGVHRASRLLSGGGDAAESIVVLSDGGDTTSTRSPGDVVADLEASGATVWAVGLESGESDRGQLVALTGTEDRVLSAANADELRGIYQNLASDLSRQYLLRYDSQSSGRTTIGVNFGFGDVQASTSAQTTIDATARAEPEPTVKLASPDPFIVSVPPLGTTVALSIGVGAVAVAVVLLLWVVALAPRERSSRRRLLPSPTPNQRPGLTSAAEWVTDQANRRLSERPFGTAVDRALERAGLDMRAGEFVIGVLSTMIVAFALGMIVANALFGFVLALVVGVGARVYLAMRRDKRQAAFADQFIDILQLLAGSLRAGYGLLQGVDSVSRDAEEPAASEFRRILIEHRLGRDLTEAMENCAERMGSDDFAWVVQAIGIHRDVGGDLARVLDNIVGTVRERAAVQRQVRALSAEGRLSARVLTALPVVVALVISLTDPDYFSEMTSRPVGLVLLTVAALMLLSGTLLVRKLVKIRY